MRAVSTFCLITLLAFVGSCNFQIAQTQPATSNILLEVYSESPTNYPPDKYLLLCVYEDQRIEYDSFPEKPQFPVPLARKTGTVDRTMFAELRDAVNEFAASNDRRVYEPQLPMKLDSHIDLTVRYRSDKGLQGVVVSENDSHIHLDQLPNAALAKLLRLAREIRVTGKMVSYTNDGTALSGDNDVINCSTIRSNLPDADNDANNGGV